MVNVYKGNKKFLKGITANYVCSTEVTDETLNISTFKNRLKTFLFKQSFPDE